eukprot:166361-Amphidinium_carterae.2
MQESSQVASLQHRIKLATEQCSDVPKRMMLFILANQLEMGQTVEGMHTHAQVHSECDHRSTRSAVSGRSTVRVTLTATASSCICLWALTGNST